jgi:predicted amidohydrolase YtcJ
MRTVKEHMHMCHMHMLMPRIVALCLAGVALGGIRPGAQRAGPPAADLLLVNGRIYTLDPARPWAEAIAVSGSRIAAVGANADVRRAAAAGARVVDLEGAFALPGFNDAHVHIDSMRWMQERIGAGRSRGAYAFRRLKDSGAVLIFGSDSPGTNAARYFLSPVYGLYAAVTRQTLDGEPKAGWFPDERLTIEEAIEAYTKGPAWASFEENVKGTLQPGRLADIAVFDTDLEAGKANPARLLEAKVLYTIAGGRVVYEAK